MIMGDVSSSMSLTLILLYEHSLVDILQEHLIKHRIGRVFARSVAVAPWGLRLPGTIQLAVHAVAKAILALDGRERRTP